MRLSQISADLKNGILEEPDSSDRRPVSCSLCGNLLIVRFVRRWRFFPLMGQADGLRQPVHAEDVTTACVSALTMPAAANRTYNLSDGETLSYREMVCRVFATVGNCHTW